MGKAVGGALKFVAGAALVVFAAPIAGAILGAAASAAAVAAVTAVATTIGGTLLASGAAALASAGRATQTALGRLNLTFDTNAPRKLVFGNTATGTDIIYQQASADTEQEYISTVIAVAAHRMTEITSIYSEDKIMWTQAGGVQGQYAGYLTVTRVLEGVTGTGTPIEGGAKWTANASVTGCSYVILRIKRTGNDSKADSPFASGLPSRMTIIGKGLPVYDPRRDSTVGGSGSHRANDQSTWAYADGSNNLGENPALQALTYLLGWKIGGVLSVGVGLPANRFRWADWIAAANTCDESVTTSAGTTKRYLAGGLFTDADNPRDVLNVLCQAMNATIRDTGGLLGIRMRVNDTAGTLLTFTEDDILGDYDWQPNAPLNDSFNVVRGRFVDPSVASLYQMVPYAPRSIASPDGINRTLTLDLPLTQNPLMAQRIAEQVLRSLQQRGTFTANFGPRAWACEVGQPVRLTFGPTRMTSKLFRVVRQELKIINSDEDAQAFCPMTLVEDAATVYAFPVEDEGAVIPATAAVSYNPSNQPFLIKQGRDINVEDGAVTGDNLQINSRMENGLLGFNSAGFTMARVEGINNPPQKWVLQTTEASNSNQFQFPRFPVVGGRRVFISVRVIRTAALTGLSISANEFRADTGAGIGPVGGTQSIVPSTTAVWETFTYSGILSASAGFMQPSIRLLSGNAGTVQVAGLTVSYTQPGADETATNAPLLIVPIAQTIQADSGGTPLTDQLPRTLKASLFIGATDVSSSTTWTLFAADGTALATSIAEISSNGTITLKAQPAGGQFRTRAVRGSVTANGFTKVTTVSAPAEGGSGGGTSQTFTTFASSASTTFVEAAAEKTVSTGSAGTLTATAPLSYTAVLGDGEFGTLEAKWQYRTPAGSGTWIDFAAAVSEGVEAYGGIFISGEPEPAYDGSITVNQTKTGLTASTNYGVRMVFRSPSADTSQLYGTGTVAGS